MSKATAIGIDFGTCYTRVAIYRNEKPEIIKNDKGNESTPSVVAFTDTGILVGESAVDQMFENASNTLFGRFASISIHCTYHFVFKMVRNGKTLKLITMDTGLLLACFHRLLIDTSALEKTRKSPTRRNTAILAPY